jgi:cell wall-associated NlpC family hydrolase
MAVAPLDPVLAENDREPDEDDFDTVLYSEPEQIAVEEPTLEDGDDQLVANADPHEPATQDAPLETLDPNVRFSRFGEVPLALLISDVAGSASSDVRSRWQARLRIRQQLLADAQDELAKATTPAAKQLASAKVKLRKEQVAYAKRVLERQKTTVVERVLRAAMLAVDHRTAIHYTMDRPFEVQNQGGRARRWDGINAGRRSKNGQYPAFADCSSFLTWCYWDALGGPAAGPDILNGQSWKAGYTGSLITHGKKVPESNIRPGDLLLYGSSVGNTAHVTMFVSPGKVVSHGGEAGPQILGPHYRPDFLQVRRYVN